MDLDPKDANNQFKETIDPAFNCFSADDDENTNNNPEENCKPEVHFFFLYNYFFYTIFLLDRLYIGLFYNSIIGGGCFCYLFVHTPLILLKAYNKDL